MILSQEFDSNVLDLVKQKRFYLYKNISDFEKFIEELPGKEKFYSSLGGKKTSDKEYDHVFKVWSVFEMKTMKGYRNLYLKWDVFLLGHVFKKLEPSLFQMLTCL